WYGTWEARIKPTDVPGVLNSFYTIDWNNTADPSAENNGTKEEIDIEFLTNSFAGTSGEVHYALHKSGAQSFQTNPDVPLDFDPSAGFHVFGFEITPEQINWIVDDSVMLSYEYEGNPITITSPYQLKLNVWSAVHWIGGPPEADVACTYLIDWIRFTPYGDAAVSPGGSRPPSDGRSMRYDAATRTLSLAVAAGKPAWVDLLNVAGRSLGRWHVRSAGNTTRTLKLPESAAPGLHVVSVRSGGKEHAAQSAVLD
ncbi:MAG: family 16 glycosylhydrolase, partial [Chitinivibrionales bacterium]|nr:family 16 glycosylhydrolase [Chitinivibrionales bacterium]